MESLFLPLLVQVAVAPVRAETLLVKPVAMPAAWYDVATGFFAIAGTLLLLVIGVLLLGLARAIQGAGQTVGRKLETLSGELVPLARRLHDVAGDLQEVTQQVKGDIARLGGTAGAVDETVRDVLAVTERRVARLAALVDDVQAEAESQVASARSLLHDVQSGAVKAVRAMVSRRADTVPDDAPAPSASLRDRLDASARRLRRAPRAPMPAREVVDDHDDDWHAPPLARSSSARARRSAIADAATDTSDGAWAHEADALIAQAERALGRTFGTSGPDDDLEADPDDPMVQSRTARDTSTPASAWRAGGPRLKPTRPDR